MRIIDLSVAIENDLPVDRPGNGPVITYFDHSQTFAALAKPFAGLTPSDMQDGEAWAVEQIDCATHNGTHLDAPWHYASTMNNGARASTIDEIPLDWCYRPGVKLDFRHLPDGHVVSAAEVEDELDRIGHTLAPYDIVLINTSAAVRYGQPDYLDAGCGMGREATLYLTERGVRITGTDAWSWDAPFSVTAQSLRGCTRSLDHLGRPQGRAPDAILSSGEAVQSRKASRERLPGHLFSSENSSGIRRLDKGRRSFG